MAESRATVRQSLGGIPTLSHFWISSSKAIYRSGCRRYECIIVIALQYEIMQRPWAQTQDIKYRNYMFQSPSKCG